MISTSSRPAGDSLSSSALDVLLNTQEALIADQGEGQYMYLMCMLHAPACSKERTSSRFLSAVASNFLQPFGDCTVTWNA
jgi:hypothetical protein